MIGKIDRLNLREVWAHEAHDFTTWLEKNIDVISDATGLNLTSVEREQPAGSFSVDLIAKLPDGGTVVIENQLEQSNHDHLGKLVTYLTAYEAPAAIWIVREARPEHISAISWLNKTTDVNFFLLQAEAVRIGSSEPALLLTRIVGPSAEIKSIGIEKKNLSSSQELCLKFWTSLLDIAKSKTPLHSSISPGKVQWVGTSAGVPGMSFNYVIGANWWRIELYIDRGDKEENEWFFDQVMEHRNSIEIELTRELDWQRLDARACRIAYQGDNQGGYKSDQNIWPTIQTQMINDMIAFSDALSAPLKSIPKTYPN